MAERTSARVSRAYSSQAAVGVAAGDEHGTTAPVVPPAVAAVPDASDAGGAPATVPQRPKRFGPKQVDWHVLDPFVAPVLFRAPGLDWESVDERNVRYLWNVFLDDPHVVWGNTLALVALVLTCCEHYDPSTVYSHLVQLHTRWRTLFTAHSWTRFSHWQPTQHLPEYVRDSTLPDTPLVRGYFVMYYEKASLAVDAYLRTLPASKQRAYHQWAPPLIPHDLAVRLGVPIRRRVDAETHERRRRAADAVVPHFARIRSEAHLRWNQLHRLREQFRMAVAQVEAGKEQLPLAFSYDEPTVGQRLSFVLWNRRTYVLSEAGDYGRWTLQQVRAQTGSFHPDHEQYFLEFIRAQSLVPVASSASHLAAASAANTSSMGETPQTQSSHDQDDSDQRGELLWFGELILNDALGHKAKWGPVERVRQRQAWLRSWGYGEEDDLGEPLSLLGDADGHGSAETDVLLTDVPQDEAQEMPQHAYGPTARDAGVPDADGYEDNDRDTVGMAPGQMLDRKAGYKHLVSPFQTAVPGLLNWPKKETGMFLDIARRRTGRLFFLVEPLYAGATLGLAALDLFTTAGPRMHELLQVSLTSECLHTLEVDGRKQLILRLDPKRSDGRPVDYFVGSETKRNFEKVRRLLEEHYQLSRSDSIPAVAYTRDSHTRHRFPARPYLFQYAHKHLNPMAITACVRFLCHGLIFQSRDGRTVVLASHLLRHVFATYLHNVENVPIDIVAALLHHKDTHITSYYSAPTREQVMEQHQSFLDALATQLGDLDTAAARLPEELREQLEEARKHVGPLNRVPGGACTCYGMCPIAFECVGCVYLVPDPANRIDIVERRQAAEYWLRRAEVLGLGPEVNKMRALIQQCDVVLYEMDMIEAYRRDEEHEPSFDIGEGPST